MIPVPVARPRLPSAKSIFPYLEQIDRAGWYSNHGPLSQQFQARLSRHWGLASQDVALLTNATQALTLTLMASGARPGTHCLLPSWTFIASAGAVMAAGLIPHFVDVCPSTWAPDPADILAIARRVDVGAVLIVSPFGAPIDLAAWDVVHGILNVPVVIDGAAAFDTLRVGGPMQVGRCPVVVSLHATKVFGIGEGGALLCRDPGVMERVRRLAQFGFHGTRDALLPGVNAKLSEYAAAVGLAGLDEWSETRVCWQSVTNQYQAALPRSIGLVPHFGDDWVASTLSVICPAGLADPAALMAQHGIGTLKWWGAGCHAQPAFKDCPSEPLPVTTMFASRTLGLPFWQALPQSAIARTIAALHHCYPTLAPIQPKRIRALATALTP